jgi:RNA polymerase sigma-70 factor (ECF subfamily)
VLESLTDNEERILISQILNNPEAFRRIYHHYFPRVRAYVAYRVGHLQDTEDITSDVFVRVVEKIDTFDYRGAGLFAAWLFRVTYNQIQQYYRGQSKEVSLHEIPDIQSYDLLVDETLSQKEKFIRLYEMIRTLSPRRQEIIALRFFAELRNSEIATVLQLDERTVARHLCRGLEDLRQKYQKKNLYL